MINFKRLDKVRNCDEYAVFSELALDIPQHKAMILSKAVLDGIKFLMSSGTVDWTRLEEQVNNILQPFGSDYPLQVLEQKAQEAVRLLRFLQTKDVIASDVYFSFRSSAFDEAICGSIDFLCIDSKGAAEAILLTGSKLTLSTKARSAENKVCNNILLVCAALGASCMGPAPVKVTLCSLRSKDDKGGMVVGEYLENKCFVSLSVSEVTDETLVGALGVRCSDACERCSYSEFCKLPTFRVKTETEDVSGGSSSNINYTKAQYEVVEHRDGPLMAVAVPGAGKTRSFVGRVAKLINSGVPSSNILVCSFSNRACSEIRERIAKEVGLNNVPLVTTFNAFGYGIVRKYLGKELATPTDICLLVEELVSNSYLSGFSYGSFEGEYGLVNLVLKEFKAIEREGADYKASGSKNTQELVSLYNEYKELFLKRGFITFDEQVSMAVSFLKSNNDVLTMYQNMYKYILVDEFQDTDDAQFELATLLSGNSRNLCIVGDDDQGIYGFRGCTNRYMVEFAKYFPDAKVVIMNDNFRSNEDICRTCSSLISINKSRIEKNIVAHRQAKNPPTYIHNLSYSRIVEIVQSYVNSGGSLSDIAVIARNNKSLLKVSDALSVSGISNIPPKDYLIEDGVFALVMAFIDYIKADRFTTDSDLPLFKILRLLCPNIELKEYKAEGYSNLYRKLSSKEIFADGLARVDRALLSILFAPELVSGLRDMSFELFGYVHPVFERIIEVVELKNIMNITSLYSYLFNMKRYPDTQRVGYTGLDSVSLLTAHDSKGAEFPFVIVVDFDEFIYDEESPDEEVVRLAYVALSRAKDTLIIGDNALYGASLYKYIKDTVREI